MSNSLFSVVLKAFRMISMVGMFVGMFMTFGMFGSQWRAAKVGLVLVVPAGFEVGQLVETSLVEKIDKRCTLARL